MAVYQQLVTFPEDALHFLLRIDVGRKGRMVFRHFRNVGFISHQLEICGEAAQYADPTIAVAFGLHREGFAPFFKEFL